MTRLLRALTVVVVAGSASVAVAPSAGAVDAFAGVCFLRIQVSHELFGTTVDIAPDPQHATFCQTNEGTGTMSVSGTVDAVPDYDCTHGGAAGQVAVGVTAAFDSFSAPDVDLVLANAAGAVVLTLTHEGDGNTKPFAAAGVLEETNTPVEECLGGWGTVTMRGAVVFETPDLSCCPS